MDYENYDDDANDSDDDYFAFVEWLSDLTAGELRRAKGDRAQQKQALCRYYKRGNKANLAISALIDYLGVSSPSIIDMADYSDDEGDALMQISDSLTESEINQVTITVQAT